MTKISQQRSGADASRKTAPAERELGTPQLDQVAACNADPKWGTSGGGDAGRN